MNAVVHRTLAAALLACTALTAEAQTYARGDLVWNNTGIAVAGAAGCLGCHTVTAPLNTLRTRFATLTQAQIRTRIDMSIAGTTAGGLATGMAALYPATTITAADRDALALYLGNFIGLPVASAAPTQLNALSATAGGMASTTLNLVNNGRLPLVVGADLVFSGTNAADFSRMPVGAGCAGQTVAAAGSCSETIRFSPPAGVTGTRAAQMTVTHTGTPAATTVIVVSGMANAPSATPPPGGGTGGGGGAGTQTNVGAGGALWPWALLLLASIGLRRRR